MLDHMDKARLSCMFAITLVTDLVRFYKILNLHQKDFKL